MVRVGVARSAVGRRERGARGGGEAGGSGAGCFPAGGLVPRRGARCGEIWLRSGERWLLPCRRARTASRREMWGDMAEIWGDMAASLPAGSYRVEARLKPAASRLCLGCLGSTSLHLGCTSAAPRLHFGLISAALRLHLGCTSAVGETQVGGVALRKGSRDSRETAERRERRLFTAAAVNRSRCAASEPTICSDSAWCSTGTASTARRAGCERRLFTAAAGRGRYREYGEAAGGLPRRAGDHSRCLAVRQVAGRLWGEVAFSDYIASPKANGYCSLHSTYALPSGTPLELQARDRGR